MNKLLYFYQKNCGPCGGARVTVKGVRHLTDCEVVEIDVDKSPELVEQYKVKSTPTVIVVDAEGRRIAGFVGGLINPKALQRALQL